jgi:hypothetical protein
MDKKGIGLVVVLLFLGLFGVGMGGFTVFEHNVAVQEGQPTAATVLSTEIAEKTDDDGDKSYRPVVTYEYIVDGQTYESENVFPGGFTRWKSSRSWAEDVLNQYEAGDRITVQYRPRNPGQAYVRNDGLPFTWVVGAGYAVLVLVSGVYLIRQGFKRRKQRTLMTDTPTEDAESLSMGPSEITGVATPGDDGPTTAPFSDEDCVVAQYEIEEYESDDDGGNWKTIEEGVRHVPFSLDDGTGRVPVRPHDDATYDLEPADWTTTRVDSSDRGPAPVQAFVESTPDLGYPGSGDVQDFLTDAGLDHVSDAGSDGDRKYKQNLIGPGEEVYVFGTVQPREDGGGTENADNLVIRKVTDEDARMEPMFMISDDAEADLIDRRRWALWRIPVGIGFAVVGIGLLVGMFGPPIGVELPILY